MAMVRRSREQWAEIVSSFSGSKLSAEAFAKSRGVNVATLRWWRRELGRERGATVGGVAFVDVVVAEEETGRAPAEPFVVVVSGSGHRVVVPRNFDDDDVRRLVRALC
jgi:transposase-like protein